MVTDSLCLDTLSSTDRAASSLISVASEHTNTRLSVSLTTIFAR